MAEEVKLQPIEASQTHRTKQGSPSDSTNKTNHKTKKKTDNKTQPRMKTSLNQ
jgi:hypothetical protein